MGLNVKTLALDPELKTDLFGYPTSLLVPDADFDVVCAF